MKMLARHLLLAALLLRAMVPLGWMPGTAQLGQASWIICTADGQIQHGTPGKDDAGQHQQPCAFAAAQVLVSPAGHALPVPLLQVAAIDSASVSTAPAMAAHFTPQSPRGPPISL